MLYPLCPSFIQAHETQTTVEAPSPWPLPQERLSSLVRIQSPLEKNNDQSPSVENSIQCCHRPENPLNRETERASKKSL